MALALSTWLHSEGWFSHGLQGEHPSMAGHGSHRLLSMLQGSGMVGDGEQYASLMALMARELGLPSRVVLGVIPKDGNGMLSSTRAKQIDGHTVTEFTGNDIEAWVEIELERFGWVPFFPTPKETKTPDESQDLTPTSVESPLVRSSPSLADPLREERDPPDQAQQEERNTPASEKPRAWHAFLRIAGVVALCLGPVWLVGIRGGIRRCSITPFECDVPGAYLFHDCAWRRDGGCWSSTFAIPIWLTFLSTVLGVCRRQSSKGDAPPSPVWFVSWPMPPMPRHSRMRRRLRPMPWRIGGNSIRCVPRLRRH